MKAAFAALLLGLPARADSPEVVTARALPAADGWRFEITLKHPDNGWDHYADAWRVETPDGRVLGERILLHPHEAGQPFTRALDDVAVPDRLDHVLIRPRCLVDGWSETTFDLSLSR